ncbi:MAG: amidophosphoribosyltransferase, partial [Bdellovibrionota bacterium]
PTGEAHMVASESAALTFLGYEPVRDLKPGEVLSVGFDGKVQHRIVKQERTRNCMFEWVYFASPESEIDGVPVYGARIRLGISLAKLLKVALKKRKIEADLVVPVPETSRIAAIALAEEIGIPYREVLIKNRYIKRTFLLDSQEKRQKAVGLKLSPVRSEIKGKRVIVVDDSIVRGTTSRKIIELVRQAGASKVYFISTCPPIRFPCYYGIDFPNRDELIAADRDAAQIEKELGADAVIYQDVEGLRQAIFGTKGGDAKERRPCMACLDGKYPTDISQGIALGTARARDRAVQEEEGVRT